MRTNFDLMRQAFCAVILGLVVAVLVLPLYTEAFSMMAASNAEVCRYLIDGFSFSNLLSEAYQNIFLNLFMSVWYAYGGFYELLSFWERCKFWVLFCSVAFILYKFFEFGSRRADEVKNSAMRPN